MFLKIGLESEEVVDIDKYDDARVLAVYLRSEVYNITTDKLLSIRRLIFDI